jgi:hypothetical protein
LFQSLFLQKCERWCFRINFRTGRVLNTFNYIWLRGNSRLDNKF